jgi:hypothetical protein
MKKIALIIILIFSNIFAYDEYINLGRFKNDSSIYEQKDIKKLTDKFLKTDYVSNTLSNSQIDTSKENLIVNFEALDCFTFIDTIKALKQSHSFKSFKTELLATRYKDSHVGYHTRNHFFSDWLNNPTIENITCKIGNCKKSIKYLNKNYKYLKEIPTVKREIAYIHPKNIDISKLKNGDYIGIYTNKPDLDVTHTGIIIKKNNKVYIRHASSKYKKVMDSELFEYTKKKLGILVYRDKKDI